ncbi:MAG TPA: ATP-binding protein [Candidatus Limnocylindrales bacterium]|nr:ATP-binding protein [Candidatus Limnocylindrales bacterium]
MTDESQPPGGERRADRGRPTASRAERQRLAQERRWAMRARRGRMGLRGGPPWGGGWSGSERPEWWPAEQPWPPARRRPWRGFGCLFGFLFVAGVLGLLSLGTALVGDVLRAPGPLGAVIRIASIVVLVAILAGLIRGARAIRGTGSVLDALVEQAARVEAGDYRARVEPPHPVPDPVRQLTRGFNTMAARLEADEAQRRTLLADVTHELRTPLAVIRGSVEAILDGVHPADEPHLAAILEEAHVLDRLIEDLRTLALSETGGLSLHREPTDLGVLVGDVATSFAATAGAAGVTIEPAIDDDIPLLDVDPVRIREVIGNLVANAIRHSSPGGRIAIRGRREAAGHVEIVVRDTGTGIPPELLPHVFERFARGESSSGSGLGLSIARGLVELHGGTIAAASPPAGGAEIRIVLPLEPERR